MSSRMFDGAIPLFLAGERRMQRKNAVFLGEPFEMDRPIEFLEQSRNLCNTRQENQDGSSARIVVVTGQNPNDQNFN